MPLSISVNIGNLPAVQPAHNSLSFGKLDWSNVTKNDLDVYLAQTDTLLSNTDFPKNAIACSDINCKDPLHGLELCNLYESIVKFLHKAKPGWNEHVKELHAKARRAFKTWVEGGRQKHGPLFEPKKRANGIFKYVLCFIKRKENAMKSNLLARKMQNNSTHDFWKEIKNDNNYKIGLPTNIDGVNGPEEIIQMWQKHYYELFGCVKSSLFMVVDNIFHQEESFSSRNL